MIRAVKVSLKFATASKRSRLENLLKAYRSAVNFYLQKQVSELKAEQVYLLKNSRLSILYRSQACREAILIRSYTLKSGTSKGKIPEFAGDIKLDAKFVTIQPGKGSFDLVVKISSLNKGKRLVIPTKKTALLNRWLSVPGAKLIQGCCISQNYLTLWVEVPDKEPKSGKSIGVDLGVRKLLADSNGNFYGAEFRKVRDKICRRKRGSKNYRQSLAERDNLINRAVNQLPWNELGTIFLEDLSYIKYGKSRGTSRNFRRKLAPWAIAKVVTRIKNVAEQNRVCVQFVDPANTSRTCPICKTVSKDNRSGEHFCCVKCQYTADADLVGALNVLTKGLNGNFGKYRVSQSAKTLSD